MADVKKYVLQLTGSDACATGAIMRVADNSHWDRDKPRYVSDADYTKLERQLTSITDQRDTLARQCNLNAQGVNAISGIIGERNEYKHELAEARKAALEEAARIADKIGEQAADGSDSLSSESIEEIHSWNDMQCHRANGCFKVASEIRKSISAPGRGQQHGECPACTILDQSLERGEGTHLEGTRQHPKGQKEGK